MSRHESLPEAQPSVASGNFRVSENLKTILPQPLFETRKQIDILKGSPTQTYTFHAGALANPSRQERKHIHQPVVKPLAHDACGNAAAQFAHQYLKHGESIDQQFTVLLFDAEGIGALIAPAADGHFELDGRLRLVADLRADSGERRHGVKQPAATGRQWRVHAAFHHPEQHFHFGAVELTDEGYILPQEIAAEMLRQEAHGHPPRLTNGGLATRHRHVGEMRCPLKIPIVGEKYFPAPNPAICAVACAIQSEADHPPLQVILRHAARDVSMVMLNADFIHSLTAERPASREVIGMQVIGDATGRDFKDALEVRNHFVEEPVSFQVFEVADVLAQEGVTALREADRVFHFAAHGEDRWQFLSQENGHRHVSSRAPPLANPVTGAADHRIIAAQQNVSVVHKKEISRTRQPPQSLLVVDDNRLFADVAAGHYEGREAPCRKEQIM